MSKMEQALSCMEEGFSCSQSIFSTFAADFGIDRETALKIASSFGGGMACTAETCGAVTGAFMVLGLKYGRTVGKDEETKQRNYDFVLEFIKRFRDKHGSICCRELLGHDISTTEGRERMKEEGLFETLCRDLVRSSVEILEILL